MATWGRKMYDEDRPCRTHSECTICLEKFKEPKILPCFHTFCLACLTDYVKAKVGMEVGLIECPLCRAEVRLPPGGVQNFQTNFYIEFRSMEAASPTIPCGTCAFNLPVRYRCLDCDEQYCRSCGDAHRKMKMARDHRFVDIRAGGGSVCFRKDVLCSSHPEKKLEFICEDCNVVICCSCKLTLHEGHFTQILNDVADSVRRRIGEILSSKLEQTQENVISAIKSTFSRKRTELTSNKDRVVGAMTERCAELCHLINGRCHDLINTLETAVQDEVETLNRAEEEFQSSVIAMDTLYGMVQQMILMSADADLVEHGPPLCEQMKDAVNEVLARGRVPADISEARFKPGDSGTIADIFGNLRLRRGEDGTTDETELKTSGQGETCQLEEDTGDYDTQIEVVHMRRCAIRTTDTRRAGRRFGVYEPMWAK